MVVACCLLERTDFAGRLEGFAGHPRLCGVRQALHALPDDLSRSCVFVENARLLAQRSLSFDLCVLARQLPIAIELVRKCPDVQSVLDHCGMPDIKERALDPWRSHLRELAALPNVVGCKIRGLLTCANHNAWTSRNLHPFVDHAFECFGMRRVMFGSDWTICTQAGSLALWVHELRQMAARLSISEQERFFRHNAIHIYRLRL